ncbi:MAG: class I SAM-dependent methyltransferase [Clostridia bacterium]|nr:class I SAM-dependent methyltransferase [Clostridia bacterium]
MNSYTMFAEVYDKLINVDYIGMADRIEDIFIKYGKKPNLVLDLACGTGNLTMELSRRGYDIIGIDLSEDMLSLATEKAPDIRFLCQDMTEFELYGTVDAIVCTLDAINYITDKRRLKKMFKLVHNYLNPDGIFIFDINTEHKLKNVLSNNTFVYDEDDIFYTWENYYKNGISTQMLNFFVNTKEGYKRFFEEHIQRAYTVSEIKEMLKDAKLDLLQTFTWEQQKKIVKNTEKIVFASKKIC